ncbi:hypothetical protein ACF1AO_34675 [Streptomyces longwoodensis]|uniref:hypothetical protein n=1 Tax=Streptomyces longwoodensis TaxID=68231 RepID=UPI00370227E7
MSGDMRGGRPEDAEGRPKRLPRARPRLLTRARVGWPPALRELKDLLYEVYLAAGTPSLDEISKDIAADDDLPGAPLRDTISRVISDSERPQQQADVVAVATVLARRAAWEERDLARRVRELWVRARMARRVGRPISELRDDLQLVLDRGLGIHPALDTEDARDRFGILPAYVLRDHDALLNTVVDAAVAGDSGIAVLVGGSSTGKTRALWEAVRELPDGWRLWHPLTPTAPEAVLAALPDIAPRTVVWLNEAQRYLAPDPLGEQVAAGLRELLTDPSRAPVLVLGTLWLEHWDALTTADEHRDAPALLDGHKIDVPKAFTPAGLAALRAIADADPRLKQAARHADDAQVTQYLAGVPYLMDRYYAAEGATRALIHAAMDARRLGAGLHIPLDWLADAALGYLTETEYRALDAHWLSRSLAYVTKPCKGIPGILSPVNTSDPRNQRNSRRSVSPTPRGPHYLLADYLDQYGRRHRAAAIPPIDFWSAAATHAHPTDLPELGNAAWNRGLYRDAAQLHKNATTHGSTHAARCLVERLHTLHPTNPRPAQWAAEHVALGNPSAVAGLLRMLRGAGAHEQAAALLARDPAAHAGLEDLFAVAELLQALWEAGAHEPAAALAGRAAAHAALHNLYDIVRLLQTLWEAGAHEPAAALAERAAAHAALHNLYDIAELLQTLWEAGAHEPAAALAERAAAHAALDNPDAVVELLRALWWAEAHEQTAVLLARDPAAHAALNAPSAVVGLLPALWWAGAPEQAAALAGRAAAHAALNSPAAVAGLLYALRWLGGHEQAAVLAGRAAAHAALDKPFAVAQLLQALREAEAHEQTATLARRAAANIPLDNPFAVAHLLQALWEARAHEQTATLLARDPGAHAALDNPFAVAQLLQALWKARAHEQSATLARRAAANIPLDDPGHVAWLLRELRAAGAREQATILAGRAVANTCLDNPVAVSRLLEELREAGAQKQVTALARRAAENAPLDNPVAVVSLLRELRELREAGAQKQVTALARRAAENAPLDNPIAVCRLLEELREAGAQKQVTALARRAAENAPLDNPVAVVSLLRELRAAGADQQATSLAKRLPAAGHFDLFIKLKLAGNWEQFRLGREPDGSAAPSWTWDDLD